MGVGWRREPLEAVTVNSGGEGFPEGLLVITSHLTDLYVELPSDLSLKAFNGRADIVLTLGWNDLREGR